MAISMVVARGVTEMICYSAAQGRTDRGRRGELYLYVGILVVPRLLTVNPGVRSSSIASGLGLLLHGQPKPLATPGSLLCSPAQNQPAFLHHQLA